MSCYCSQHQPVDALRGSVWSGKSSFNYKNYPGFPPFKSPITCTIAPIYLIFSTELKVP